MVNLIANVNDFNDAIKNATLTVIHFAADWVEECKQVDNVLDLLANEYKSDLRVAKCAAEDLAEVSLKYQIDAVPVVLFFRNGSKIDRIDGADAARITAKVQTLLKSNDSLTLESRMKALINKANVMLFMKGDRQNPRCGFSREVIAILNNTKVDYDTFDILTDEEIRQGLKTFSNWPTYPQLYVRGVLIGGLDILRELQDDNELVDTLLDKAS